MTRAAIHWIGSALALSALAFMLSSYEADLYRKLLIWVALALSFNFLFGIAGQMAMSHFAFAGIGAYAMVILTFKLSIPLLLSVPLSAAFCAVVALLIAVPAVRLEGFFLALATIALAQLLIIVLNEGGQLTGGTTGITSYGLPRILGFEIKGPSYTSVIVLVVLATLWVLIRLDHSGFGRACRAIRDNPVSAAAMGVDVARTKVVVFTITSVLAAIAGMAYAFIDNIVTPGAFTIDNMFDLLFMVIIGGAGSHLGAVIGTVLLYMAPFVMEPIVGNFHLLIFGFLLVLTILFQPNGVVGLLDRLMLRWRQRASAVR
jgi:branched-chain amino acid transport system permease protein